MEDRRELLPRMVPLAQVAAIAAGDSHSSLRDQVGRLWLCGSGEDGQLGLGDNEDRGKPEQAAALMETLLAHCCDFDIADMEITTSLRCGGAVE